MEYMYSASFINMYFLLLPSERAKLEPPQEDEDYELCLQKMRTEAVQPV